MRNPFSSNPYGQTPDPSAYSFGQTPGAGQAQSTGQTAPDERVRGALVSLQYPNIVVSEYNNFHVTLKWSSDGRSQMIVINSWTTTYRGREWRKVWSEAFSVEGPLPAKQAQALLVASDRWAIGGWYAYEDAGRTGVCYQVSVPADAQPFELEDAIQMAGAAADDMEKATVGTDTH